MSFSFQGASLAVGIYVGAGSKDENPYTVGAAHLLERMAFRATANRTSFRVTREAEVIGANLLASASREQMAYTVDCLKTNLPEAVELVADVVMNPKLADHEVAEVASALKAEMTEISANPANLMMEAVHAVAFDGGLGQPLVATPGALSHLDGDARRTSSSPTTWRRASSWRRLDAPTTRWSRRPSRSSRSSPPPLGLSRVPPRTSAAITASRRIPP